MEKFNWETFYKCPSIIAAQAAEGHLEKVELSMSYNQLRTPTHVFAVKVFYTENSLYKKQYDKFPTEYAYDCQVEGLNVAFGSFMSHLMMGVQEVSIKSIHPTTKCPSPNIELHYLIKFE